MLEKILKNPWTASRSTQSILKKVSPDFFGRTDAEAEAEVPILWPSDAKSRLTRKDSDAAKD